METVLAAIRNALNLNQNYAITEATKLRDLRGWDSMTSVNLELELESKCGIRAGMITLTDETTVADIVAVMHNQL